LRRSLGKASMYYVELYTVLCDVKAVITERPLTYVSSADDWEVLSPAWCLRPMQSQSVGTDFLGEVVDLDQVDAVFLKGRFTYLQTVRNSLR